MNKEEVWKQRKVSFWGKVRSLFYGWQTRHIWNMPKKQPCPECYGLRPRGRKLVGAEYHCNKCKKDFHIWRQVILE